MPFKKIAAAIASVVIGVTAIDLATMSVADPARAEMTDAVNSAVFQAFSDNMTRTQPVIETTAVYGDAAHTVVATLARVSADAENPGSDCGVFFYETAIDGETAPGPDISIQRCPMTLG